MRGAFFISSILPNSTAINRGSGIPSSFFLSLFRVSAMFSAYLFFWFLVFLSFSPQGFSHDLDAGGPHGWGYGFYRGILLGACIRRIPTRGGLCRTSPFVYVYIHFLECPHRHVFFFRFFSLKLYFRLRQQRCFPWRFRSFSFVIKSHSFFSTEFHGVRRSFIPNSALIIFR